MIKEQNKLNFGCGKNILKGFINVDLQKARGIDKSFDFNKFPYPFKNNVFDYILVDNVLEHLDNLNKVINELRRISKNSAIIEIIVPYWNSNAQSNDWTHKHSFNKTSLKNLFEYNATYRYDSEKKFEIIKFHFIKHRFLTFLPISVCKILAHFLCNIIVAINIKVKVMK